jgi:hypothetical protein
MIAGEPIELSATVSSALSFNPTTLLTDIAYAARRGCSTSSWILQA